MYAKTTPPRSGLAWKPTGRIFTFVGLRWIPTRKNVETCLNTNDSAIPLGKEKYSPNTVICANSSSMSAGGQLSTRCEGYIGGYILKSCIKDLVALHFVYPLWAVLTLVVTSVLESSRPHAHTPSLKIYSKHQSRLEERSKFLDILLQALINKTFLKEHQVNDCKLFKQKINGEEYC
ncbi:hypothetical protein Tco_0919440 [Tanacetum coccineum]